MNDGLFKPIMGSQRLFCASKSYEVFYSGTRGNGKSECALYKAMSAIGKGYGRLCRIIIFRMNYKDLDDLIEKSKFMFLGYYPGAVYKKQEKAWVFPEGETVIFSNLDDYSSVLGKGFLKMIIDELPEMPNADMYTEMLGSARCMSVPGLSQHLKDKISDEFQIISTGNPYGVGFSWVKKRFVTECGLNNRVTIDGVTRECIHGTVWENTPLLEIQPNYIRASFGDIKESLYKAWVMGSWDTPQGSIFDEYWDEAYNVVKPFRIPSTWVIDRTFDWGSTRPFALDYWAISDGSPYEDANGNPVETIFGDIFKIHEYYGCKPGKKNIGLNMSAREVAIIVKRTDAMIFNKYNVPVRPGVCDIDPMRSIEMQRESVFWKPITPKIKERVPGWELCQRKMKSARTRSEEGFFVFDTCKDFIRIITSLPRCPKNPFDVDTTSEDHLADSMRYKIKDSQIQMAHSGAVFGL